METQNTNKTSITHEKPQRPSDRALALLIHEQEALQTEVDKLTARLNQHRQSLDKLNRAIGELTGKPVSIPSRSQRKAKKKNAPLSFSLPQVISIITDLLSEHGSLNADQIKDLVGKKAVEMNRSRIGIHNSIAAALRDSRFKESDGVWRLSNNGKEI